MGPILDYYSYYSYYYYYYYYYHFTYNILISVIQVVTSRQTGRLL